MRRWRTAWRSAIAPGVNGPGEHALAGSAFAAQEHRGIARRDLPGEIQHPLHQRAAALQPRVIAGLIDHSLQTRDLLFQHAELQHALAHQAHLCRRKRLGEVIERAQFHGLNRAVDRAVRGDHDHLDPRALRQQARD